MKNKNIFFSFFLILFCSSFNAQTLSYYVDPAGSDLNPGTLSMPFKNIDKARLTIRNHPNKSSNNFHVFIRGGEYNISSSLMFDELDGGLNGYKVVYQNYLNEQPVLSGGVNVTGGWQNVSGKPYKKLAVSQSNFRQLYVNGHRKQRAKTNKLAKAFNVINASTQCLLIDSSFFNFFTNITNAEIHMQIEWKDLYFKIDSLKKANDPFYRLYFNSPTTSHGEFYLENSIDLLDEKGEWYMDNLNGFLYYYPEDSVNINNATITIPVTERLLTIKGSTPNNKVNKLFFNGITFCYAGWQAPNNNGFFTAQGSELILPLVPNPNFGGIYGWTNKIFSNIYCENADSLIFNSCKFEHMGALAVDLRNGIYRSEISCCYFYDISEGGLSVSDAQHDKIDFIGEDSCNYISIKNNVFFKTGQDYFSAVALGAFYAKKITIVHNEIFDCPNIGISFGWGWSGTPWASTTCNYNTISYNKIGNYLRKTRDGGGIYTLGPQPGTSVCNNYIHHEGQDFGGLYFDEGSKYITAKNNVLSKTHYWLYLWTSSIQNIIVDSCYTDTSLVLNNAINSIVTNTFLVSGNNWPATALSIISSSGLQSPCSNVNQNLPNTIISGTPNISIPLTYTINLAENLNLSLNISDTSNLVGYSNYFWKQLSGPGTITFTYPKLPNIRAAFSLPGIYTIKCSFDNSYQTISKTITVTVNNYNLCSNMALNKYIKAGSIGYGSPSNMVDGLLNTLFETQYYVGNVDSSAIQINLGSPQSINRVEITDRQDPFYYEFGCYGISVFVSNDSTFSNKVFFNAIYQDGPILKQGTITFNNAYDTTKYKFIRLQRNAAWGNSIAEIRAYSFPLTKIANSSYTICTGQSLELNATGAASYTWSTGANSNSITVSPNTSNYYFVSGINAQGCANTDSCLVNVSNCFNSTNEILSNANKINVYPNPTAMSLIISIVENSLVTGIIYDVSGKIVYDKFKMLPGDNQVDISSLNAGSYILKIVTKDYIIYKKIIKMSSQF